MYQINDMAIFVRVVERQGLTAAGQELRLTAAVVSSRIAKLEERLGVRLLNRTTRSVSMTEEGRVYYDYCQRILEEMQNAEQALEEMKRSPAGPLRISVSVAFGRNYIAPLVPEFLEQHEKIQLRLQVTDRVVDVVDEEVDIALRKGILPASTLIMRRLVPDLRIVCAAPEYFEKYGVPQTPKDLKNHNCLLLRFPGSLRFTWRFEDSAGEHSNLRLVGSMEADSSDVLIDWALAGKGLIMKSIWDIAPYLESGQLQGVLADYWPRNLEISALMPPRRPQPPQTRAFLDFLIAKFADHPMLKYTDPANIPLVYQNGSIGKNKAHKAKGTAETVSL